MESPPFDPDNPAANPPALDRPGRHPPSRPTTTPIDELIDELPMVLRGLAARGEPRRYRKGTLLIQEGDHGDSLYIILAGRLRAFSSGDGNKEITYGEYGPGEYVGEMSLDGGPRSAHVEALQATVCSTVSRITLTRHIAEHPEMAFELITKLIRRARAATVSARQMALNDVYGRLKFHLDAIAEAGPDGTRVIRERLTHQALAHRLGCVREMVSRLLKDLERGGWIVLHDGLIHLPRPLPARW